MPQRFLHWHSDESLPDAGDVIACVETNHAWRIESIRPVSRGPNAGVRHIYMGTRLPDDWATLMADDDPASGVPDGAWIVFTVPMKRGERV